MQFHKGFSHIIFSVALSDYKMLPPYNPPVRWRVALSCPDFPLVSKNKRQLCLLHKLTENNNQKDFSVYLSNVKKTTRWKIAQALEIKWWKRYLKDKEPAEYLAWKTNYWQELLQELNALKMKGSSHVLDAGCGPAGMFLALDKYSVTAVDPLLSKYQNLPHFQPEKYPYTDFQVGTIEQMNFEQEFDTVFCLNAINHVSDIHLAYDNICKAVKKDGQLVVSIDAHNHSFLKKIFKALPGDVLHPHQYDLKEYESFLTDRGFEIEQTLLKDSGKIFNYYVQVARRKN